MLSTLGNVLLLSDDTNSQDTMSKKVGRCRAHSVKAAQCKSKSQELVHFLSEMETAIPTLQLSQEYSGS